MESNVTYNITEELYSGLFENRSSKVAIILTSFIIDLVNIALAYGVIWYDHFGIDLKRTLMNKLVTSICWAAIIDVPLIQLCEIPRYFFGPQPALFCFVQSFLKNSIKWQILLLLDASILARYIFIFWLKNPSAVHDDFWSIFTNLWIAGLSVITNFVLFSRPGGKMPIHYYVCANIDPASEAHLPSSAGFIDVLSILLHLIIKARITWYVSNKPSKPVISCISSQASTQNLGNKNSCIEENSLADFTTHFALIFISLLISLLFAKTNGFTLEAINVYPNYLFMYSLHFVGISVMCSAACIIQYMRHPKMRKTIFTEFCTFMNCIE